MLKKLSLIVALVSIMAFAAGCAEEGEPTNMMEEPPTEQQPIE